MGQGYSLGCKRCGYKISANLGVGFAFPRVYEAVMKEAQGGKLGETVQSFLKEHPDGALDCDQVLRLSVEWIYLCIFPRMQSNLGKKVSGQQRSPEMVIHILPHGI